MPKLSPGAPKWSPKFTKNCSKMAPWSALGRPGAPEFLFLIFGLDFGCILGPQRALKSTKNLTFSKNNELQWQFCHKLSALDLSLFFSSILARFLERPNLENHCFYIVKRRFSRKHRFRKKDPKIDPKWLQSLPKWAQNVTKTPKKPEKVGF